MANSAATQRQQPHTAVEALLATRSSLFLSLCTAWRLALGAWLALLGLGQCQLQLNGEGNE